MYVQLCNTIQYSSLVNCSALYFHMMPSENKGTALWQYPYWNLFLIDSQVKTFETTLIACIDLFTGISFHAIKRNKAISKNVNVYTSLKKLTLKFSISMSWLTSTVKTPPSDMVATVTFIFRSTDKILLSGSSPDLKNLKDTALFFGKCFPFFLVCFRCFYRNKAGNIPEKSGNIFRKKRGIF